ncbi:hypothetical protein G4B88_000705 [Cannabis sativa]|uniref:Endonuclease/exonuclease/phosphatase domain-containing protein n=1 Tax=Cannabis sativa TaxID=3483 RepID=A0A7J6DWT8_CANSA|nr:hypothetical protein G4B88_000705 [Cannabis sativa]
MEKEVATGVGRGQAVIGDLMTQKLKAKMQVGFEVGHKCTQMDYMKSPSTLEAGQSSIGLQQKEPNISQESGKQDANAGVEGRVEVELENEGAGRKRQCGRLGSVDGRDARPIEGAAMEDMVALGNYKPGHTMEGQGTISGGKESRKCFSIKNKARAKARSGGNKTGCALAENTSVRDVDRVGLSGGLLLMWKDDIKVQVLSSSPGHILATVAGSGFSPWFFTGFYGNPDASQRHFSWRLLRDLRKEVQGPWLCIGDFNEISSLSEKVGGRDRLPGVMDGFKEVLDDCRFMDFSSVKHDLTWCNEHGTSPIMERLDRGLCTEEWLAQFEGADISLLDWWESDHRALVVDMPIRIDGSKCGKTKRKSRFHFEEAWCQEEECTEIVDQLWKESSSRGRPYAFRCKINKCGKALHDWNKKKKKRLNSEIEQTKKALHELTVMLAPSHFLSVAILVILAPSHFSSMLFQPRLELSPLDKVSCIGPSGGTVSTVASSGGSMGGVSFFSSRVRVLFPFPAKLACGSIPAKLACGSIPTNQVVQAEILLIFFISSRNMNNKMKNDNHTRGEGKKSERNRRRRKEIVEKSVEKKKESHDR